MLAMGQHLDDLAERFVASWGVGGGGDITMERWGGGGGRGEEESWFVTIETSGSEFWIRPLFAIWFNLRHPISSLCLFVFLLLIL